MGEINLNEFLDKLSPDLKKEILQALLISLLEGLNEDERKDIIQSALISPKKNRELIEMVGH